MSDITLTSALRSNLLSLQGTQKLLDTTQYRLATGKKVNSALDNASAFFTAQSLTNRANDLSALLDGQAQAVEVLKAADAGITSLTTLIKQAQGIAQAAQSSLSSSGAVRSGDISKAFQDSLDSSYAGALTLYNGTTTATVTITAGDTLSSVAAAINATTGFTANIVDGSDDASDGSKRLEIRATGGKDLTLGGAGVTALNTANGGTDGAGLGGIALDGTTGGIVAGTAVASSSNSIDAVSLQKQYKVIYDQITQLVADTGYKGTNLLNGDTLDVQFNENNSSKLSIKGVTFDAAGLGLSAAQDKPAAQGDFYDADAITSTLNRLTSSLTSLRTQAQNFGNNLTVVQTREDFTSNLVNTLKEGSDQLTLADKNEEGANLLSLQTSQQLGITALSLASQASQSVLRLFG